MPSIPFDDAAMLEPRFAEVARLLEEIRDKKAMLFTSEMDAAIYEHLHALLRQATQ